jgi:SWIM zinc finger
MQSVPQQYPEPPAPVRAQHVGGELVLVLDAQLALVASQSEADIWHVVEHHRCTCKAFLYREQCRHVALVARLQLAASLRS